MKRITQTLIVGLTGLACSYGFADDIHTEPSHLLIHILSQTNTLDLAKLKQFLTSELASIHASVDESLINEAVKTYALEKFNAGNEPALKTVAKGADKKVSVASLPGFDSQGSNTNSSTAPTDVRPLKGDQSKPNGSAASKPEAAKNHPHLWKHFDVQTGIAVLRPFSLTRILPVSDAKSRNVKAGTADDASSGHIGDFDFQASGAATRGIVQGTFMRRTAWEDPIPETNSEPLWLTEKYRWPKIDYELHLGFAYGDGDAHSSATAGSGEIFGDVSLGLNLVRFARHDTNAPLLVLNAEAFGSFVTDSSFSLVHPAYGFGPSLVASIPFSSNGNPLQLLHRIGFARVDSPVLLHNADFDPNHPLIVAKGADGNPSFTMKSAVAISSEVRLPLFKVSDADPQPAFLSFGGSFYKLLDDGPDQWGFYAAFSMSLDALSEALSKFVPKAR